MRYATDPSLRGKVSVIPRKMMSAQGCAATVNQRSEFATRIFFSTAGSFPKDPSVLKIVRRANSVRGEKRKITVPASIS